MMRTGEPLRSHYGTKYVLIQVGLYNFTPEWEASWCLVAARGAVGPSGGHVTMSLGSRGSGRSMEFPNGSNVGHVPASGVAVHHPYHLLAGSLQQHLLA